MVLFPPTIILRHRLENLKKCSLRGLEERPDLAFFTYPGNHSLPSLEGYLMLDFDGPLLSERDAARGLFLLDGTWRYAGKMALSVSEIERRSLPPEMVTAYPRKQQDCPDPTRGLASVEALFIAYTLLGRNTAGLLDNYYWRDEFLSKNSTNLG
ncbi:MAG: hypothetical protein K940chlam2_00489 [Chlamydiae bacterium]|nr:hypothetical protein [Chlamydiota bacterium]